MHASSEAYVLGTFSQGSLLDGRVPTHVVVAGTSDNESDLFVQSAVTRARRYHQLYPQHQVLIMTTRDTKNGDLATGSYSGINPFFKNDRALTSQVLIETLMNFKHIRSLDFYGHGALDRGFNIDDGYRVKPDSPGIARLRGNFDKEAYVTFHACNSGFLLAPQMSRIWNIPVAGLMTGADFQVLHSDGNWYFNNKGEAPASALPVRVNEKSFSKPVGCRDGGCVRMMPTNAAYTGKLGTYDTGLGFMKFFCPEKKWAVKRFFSGSGMSTEQCEKNMALALISQPSSANASLTNGYAFARAAQDILCPVSSRGKSANCVKALVESLGTGNTNYSSFRNPDGESILECDFGGCNFQYKNVGNAYQVSSPRNSAPTTQVNEYWHYLWGFEHLKKGK